MYGLRKISWQNIPDQLYNINLIVVQGWDTMKWKIGVFEIIWAVYDVYHGKGVITRITCHSMNKQIHGISDLWTGDFYRTAAFSYVLRMTHKNRGPSYLALYGGGGGGGGG